MTEIPQGFPTFGTFVHHHDSGTFGHVLAVRIKDELREAQVDSKLGTRPKWVPVDQLEPCSYRRYYWLRAKLWGGRILTGQAKVRAILGAGLALIGVATLVVVKDPATLDYIFTLIGLIGK
jgi:hypothetical protein